MDIKKIAFKVLKGAIYGATASVTALQFAGVHGWQEMTKALLGAAVAGALHGAHDAIQQAKQKDGHTGQEEG